MMQEAVVCRFCLDSETKKNNPLIEPCLCRGSIQFVHSLCLTRWRQMNPARNADICFLCLTPYQLAIGEVFEHLPDENSLCIFFLRFPFLLWVTVNYVGVIHYSAYQKKDFSFFFEAYQYLFQLLYFLLFWSSWHVRRKQLYWRQWNHKNTYWILSLHLLSNYFVFTHNLYAILPLNYCFLYYYRNHRRILHRMNELYE